MEKASESPSRTCPKCGQTKAPNQFYKRLDTCRACVFKEAYDRPVKLGPRDKNLAAEAEAWRQEKLLREELKKLAKARFEAKKSAKRKQKREKLTSFHVHTDSKVETDPATRELARRELSKRKLIEFTKKFHPKYKAGWVHIDICERLERFSADVEAERSPRLMLLVPPRHGKSTVGSITYPAWHLGHYPHHEFIGCAYALPLARGFSRKVRNIIATPEYGLIFPKTRLDPTSTAAEEWRIDGVGSGMYNAAGVDGGITGKGAHVLSIDDPFKGIDEADNIEQRQKVWDWYVTEAYTRLAPGGGVLIIQTWWNDDDLAGRIQQMMKDNPDDENIDRFEIVRYPAIAEEDEEYRDKGEPLHPERYSLKQLLKIQSTMGGPASRHWSALYQQNPVPESGAYFARDMFMYRSTEPVLETCNLYITWDFAISEKKINDWTVGTVVAQDDDDTVHALEQVRFKTNDSGEMVRAIIELYKKYAIYHPAFGAEDGQIWRTLKSALITAMTESRVYIPLDNDTDKLSPITDKLVRGRPLQARMRARRVTFPRGEEWVDTLMKEALRFPGGAHDDTIDSLAWAVILAGRHAPPRKPSAPRNSKLEKTVQQKLAEILRGDGSDHMAA